MDFIWPYWQIISVHLLLHAVLLTIVNVYSVKLVTRLLNWLSSLKFLAYAFLVVLGIWKLIERGNKF